MFLKQKLFYAQIWQSISSAVLQTHQQQCDPIFDNTQERDEGSWNISALLAPPGRCHWTPANLLDNNMTLQQTLTPHHTLIFFNCFDTPQGILITVFRRCSVIWHYGFFLSLFEQVSLLLQLKYISCKNAHNKVMNFTPFLHKFHLKNLTPF